MNFTPKVHHSSEIFFFVPGYLLSTTQTLALGGVVSEAWNFWESSTEAAIIGEKMLRCRGAF